jgi:hypothetical protein
MSKIYPALKDMQPKINHYGCNMKIIVKFIYLNSKLLLIILTS